MALLVGAVLSSAFVVQWRPQAAPACRSSVSAVTMFGEFMKKRPGDENSFVQTEMRGAVSSGGCSSHSAWPARQAAHATLRLLHGTSLLRHGRTPAARAVVLQPPLAVRDSVQMCCC